MLKSTYSITHNKFGGNMSRDTRAIESLQKATKNKRIIYLVASFAALCVLAASFAQINSAKDQFNLIMTIAMSIFVMVLIFVICKYIMQPDTFSATTAATQQKKNPNVWSPTQKKKPMRMVANAWGSLEPADQVAGTTEWHQRTEREAAQKQANNNTKNKRKNKKNDEQTTATFMKDGKLPTPKQLFDAMGEYVIGQEEARKALAIAVYNHYKRVSNINEDTEDDVNIAKSNILILGPTGTGKTLMVQTLARILNVPLAIADATSMTDAGYVGEDVESVLGKLIANAGDTEAAKYGIIYIDEIDKVATSQTAVGANRTKDPSGEGVQQSLLKMLEGSECTIQPAGGRTNMFQKSTMLDTTHVLFICGGAFVGLDKEIEKRLSTKTIGFVSATTKEETKDEEIDYLSLVEPRDLDRFGLIPELVGRIPVITHTTALDEDTMVRILTEPKDALVKQYSKLFEYDGVKLEMDDDALRAIGKTALDRGTGARGLRSVMERALATPMFEVPSMKDVESVRITKECVTENQTPIYSNSQPLSA